jgi:hypothetical protein
MSYDTSAKCYICETGYGLSDDKLECLTPNPKESCLNGASTVEGSCTTCSYYNGYFSVGLKNDLDAQ